MTGTAELPSSYQPPEEGHPRREHFFILSGCSGAGKSTLLVELHRRGFATVEEPGRQIVKEQMGIGGDALPWVNPEKFLELLVSRYMYAFNINTMKPRSGPVFFDRSLVDAASGLERHGIEADHVHRAARSYRYAKTVFMAPPWPEIYRNDEERKHSLGDALAEYSDLLPGYEALGYEILVLPKVSVAERADFVLRETGPRA